ncbi:MAG: hypothetical protein K0B02_05020 [DPANN group archaeon]|nr:hypothetical protein [DPANN group archaeon]
MGLDILIGNLRYIGFYDFFLPFVLFIAILYALLDKSDLSDEPSVNGIIAISISFFIINYTPLGMFFSSLFGLSSIVIGGMLVFVLFGAFFGIKIDDVFGDNKGAIAIGILLLTIVVFLSTSITELFAVNSGTITTVALLFVMVLGVMMIGGNTSGGSG